MFFSNMMRRTRSTCLPDRVCTPYAFSNEFKIPSKLQHASRVPRQARAAKHCPHSSPVLRTGPEHFIKQTDILEEILVVTLATRNVNPSRPMSILLVQLASWELFESILTAFWKFPGSFPRISWECPESLLRISWVLLRIFWKFHDRFLRASWKTSWQLDRSVLRASWELPESFLSTLRAFRELPYTHCEPSLTYIWHCKASSYIEQASLSTAAPVFRI